MRSLVGLATTGLVLLAIAYFAWMHLRHTADSVQVQSAPIIQEAKKAQQTYAEAQDAQGDVTLIGPLANFISKKGPVETVQSTPQQINSSDHVGDSVVGTSMHILNDKFRVVAITDFPFEMPPHAAMPQLRGTFRSFVEAGKLTSDTDAEVDFRIVSDAEFANFLDEKPSEALFSADRTHNEEVNLSLPPTASKAAKYHLVFLNNARGKKKVVEAKFRIDF